MAKKGKDTEAPIIDAARLRGYLSYNQDTGEFRFLKHRIRARVGQLAGSRHIQGYWEVRLDNRAYLLHRLAWLYVTGFWPKDQIDHVNGNRADNRFCNLRECSNAENCQNVKPHRDGAGYVGTTWDKRRQRWAAGIGVGGRRIFLGYFETQTQAHDAYLAAKSTHHKFAGQNV